ncbi:hypothetical protein [Mesorhizobium sp. ES1-4]|nr:hypothetical protein [Mesorhizobium sp. ES1-4]MBZ9797920.1 hypothetical protein [Mesorhizobium sp. ES1-4]
MRLRLLWQDEQGGGGIATASNEAVADLKLEKEKHAYAVVKTSDVMVGID